MIKAEVISEDNGYEVPNWLTKCKDALLNPPTVGAATVLAVVAIAVFATQAHGRSVKVNETGVQSQPAATSSLQVISSDESPASTLPTTANTNLDNNSVGPAPASSLSSLQPTGSTQRPGGLSQALNQTVQSAGKANSLLNGLGL